MTISWEEYFMGVAVLSGLRSKDPNTKVGACIVSPENKIVGIGYNGTPRGWDDSDFPWGREGDSLEVKYPYVIHAELNAIVNSFGDIRGSTIYISQFSCNECAKIIAQSGIKRVVYLNDKYADTDSVKAAKRIYNKLGIKYEKLVCAHTNINIELK